MSDVCRFPAILSPPRHASQPREAGIEEEKCGGFGGCLETQTPPPTIYMATEGVEYLWVGGSGHGHTIPLYMKTLW
jgi:hypothetical protein